MPVDAVMFSTFARETAGRIEPHLRSWALQVMLQGLPYSVRTAERNRALCAAAEFLPEGLNMMERARRLHAELCRVSRSARPAHPDLSTLDGCLAQALLFRDKVPGERLIWNVLSGLENVEPRLECSSFG